MTRHEHSGRAQRAVLLAVASAVILACFWAFGGVGFAQSSVSAHQYQYGGKKVTVCHKGKKTIRVSRKALPAHLAHGDTVGKCKRDGDRGHGKKEGRHERGDRGKGGKAEQGDRKSDRSERGERADRGNGKGKGRG